MSHSLAINRGHLLGVESTLRLELTPEWKLVGMIQWVKLCETCESIQST